MGKLINKRLMNGFECLALRENTSRAVSWASIMSEVLKESMGSTDSYNLFDGYMHEFKNFFYSWHINVIKVVGFMIPISLPLKEEISSRLPLHCEEIGLVYTVYSHLLDQMDACLEKTEELFDIHYIEGVVNVAGRHHYLTLLKILYVTTYIFEGAECKFWGVMRRRKRAICALIEAHVELFDDVYRWLLEHKDKMGFELRRQLSLAMLTRVDPQEEPNELTIDRSRLLRDSFTYIHDARVEFFWAELYIKFKDEEAYGPGVVREWFCLVCKELFNQHNALYLSCPNDRRRYFPNPASKLNPRFREYFKFSGRMIALALVYRIQVGVLFDRSFFLHLGMSDISLDDIQDADPVFHRSCKQILEMEADMLDSGALGLYFATESEELGCRKVVELCPGGENIEVNSENREKYVDLLIKHRFVTSTADQRDYFVLGFASMFIYPRYHMYFFTNLELKDLDWMLCGSDVDISVMDWKAHTVYQGYHETDSHIQWFWKIVEEMSSEQKIALLFYWTSVKYLPIEGFSGLNPRLSITKVIEPLDHLPTSHTCFNQLCFPPYHSIDVMRDRLRIIAQEHFCSSFGNI